MSFTPDNPNIRKVGDAIKAELFRIIFGNLTDLDERFNSLETTGGSIFIYNGGLRLANFDSSRSDVFYHKATQDFELSEFRIQLCGKDGIATGLLKFDVQKSVDTNPANFNSVLSSELSFNFATDANYSEKVATINSSVSSLAAGEVLRVVVTSIPTGFSGKVLMNVGGE